MKVHYTYLGVSGYNFSKNIVFFCQKDLLYLYKQCRPSSGSSLFEKVLNKGISEYKEIMKNRGFS